MDEGSGLSMPVSRLSKGPMALSHCDDTEQGHGGDEDGHDELLARHVPLISAVSLHCVTLSNRGRQLYNSKPIQKTPPKSSVQNPPLSRVCNAENNHTAIN
jgi:hypothetical protein